MQLRILVDYRPAVGPVAGSTAYIAQWKELWYWKGFNQDDGTEARFNSLEEAQRFLDRAHQYHNVRRTSIIAYRPTGG